MQKKTPTNLAVEMFRSKPYYVCVSFSNFINFAKSRLLWIFFVQVSSNWHPLIQVQSNGAGASASEAVEAMEAADNVAGLQQKDQRDYQKGKG